MCNLCCPYCSTQKGILPYFSPCFQSVRPTIHLFLDSLYTPIQAFVFPPGKFLISGVVTFMWQHIFSLVTGDFGAVLPGAMIHIDLFSRILHSEKSQEKDGEQSLY